MERQRFSSNGVLSGFITLKINEKTILDYRHTGFNSTAVSLGRTVLADHIAVASESQTMDADWPLFFCAGHLENRCGVIQDFEVTHKNGDVILSHFFGCAISKRAKLVVRWRSWAKAVHDFLTDVLNHCPASNKWVTKRYQKKYLRRRTELQQLRLAIRDELRLR